MFFIIGWGHRTRKEIGKLGGISCGSCHGSDMFLLVVETTWLTLFFIPVIPLDKKYLLICSKCGARKELTQSQYRDLVVVMETARDKIIKEKPELKEKIMEVPIIIKTKTEVQENYLATVNEEKSKSTNNPLDSKAVTNEYKIIEKTPEPITKERIINRLMHIGIQPGDHLMVHCSLSKMGWVNGGEVTVIEAIQELLTLEGTLIMAAHSGDYSDPEAWQNPPVPKEWFQIIRDTMPLFDPKKTPTRGIGRVAEAFRSFPEVLRSNHPQVSISAWGKHAQVITENHPLEMSMGTESPLQKMHDLDIIILLIGVDFDSCTMLHLAQYYAEPIQWTRYSAPIIKDGVRIWESYQDVEFDTDNFVAIGDAFVKKSKTYKEGRMGLAEIRTIQSKELIQFAIEWMNHKNGNAS